MFHSSSSFTPSDQMVYAANKDPSEISGVHQDRR